MDVFAAAQQAEIDQALHAPTHMPTGRHVLDTLFQLEADTYGAYQTWRAMEQELQNHKTKNIPVGNEYLVAVHVIESQRLHAQSLAQRTGIAMRMLYDEVGKFTHVNQQILSEVNAVRTRLEEVGGAVQSLLNGFNDMHQRLKQMGEDIAAIKADVKGLNASMTTMGADINSIQGDVTVIRQLLTLAVLGIGMALHH